MIWVRRVLPMGIGAGLLYLGWLLVTANGLEVEVDFLVGRVAGVALWKALAVAFAFGAGLVGIALVLQLLRAKLVARRYQKKLSGLETEVHQLRNLPLGQNPSAGPTPGEG